MEEKLNEQQLEKVLNIRKDFWRFCKNNLYIKDKHANIIKFVPNLAQTVLINYVLKCISQGKPIRAIILKARQMGLSTAVEALIYWWTSTNKNINSVILGHEESSSKNLYTMFRRYYDNCNPLFKPSVRYNTRTDLSFEKYDEYGKQIGLGSFIKTATAGNKSAGRSDTVNWLHGSEIGEWENGEDLVASIMQTVPYEPYMEKPSAIFLESTAKGRGNYFHKEWLNAEKGLNNFIPFFFPWWIMDSYEIHDNEDIGILTDYEEFLVELMTAGHTVAEQHIDIDPEHIIPKIKYYRYKAREFASTPEKMFQEYPSTAHEAFISSGRAVFNVMSLERMEKKVSSPEVTKYYTINIDYDGWQDYILEEIPYVAQDNPDTFTYAAPLKIFKHPKPGHEYVIGGDVAEGLANGDFSVADVVDTLTMETVAKWRGHVDPDKFGEILAALGTYYNYALVGVEVNNHGLTTIQKLRDIFYTNLYKRINGYDEDFEEPTSHLGWKTDMKTKRTAIDALTRLIRDGTISDPDNVFVNEAFAFVRDDRGRMNAEAGEHDDTIMAKAIAYQLFDWGENSINDLKVVKPQQYSSRKNKHKIVGQNEK